MLMLTFIVQFGIRKSTITTYAPVINYKYNNLGTLLYDLKRYYLSKIN